MSTHVRSSIYTLSDDHRVYAFLRVQTGDEMSRRMKFALLVWVGPGVSAMKKAKLSTDKGFVKQVFVVSIALFHSGGLSHTY